MMASLMSMTATFWGLARTTTASNYQTYSGDEMNSRQMGTLDVYQSAMNQCPNCTFSPASCNDSSGGIATSLEIRNCSSPCSERTAL